MRYQPTQPLTLTDAQLAQVNAAAALLRVESRDAFLRDLRAYLAPIRRQITNSGISTALNHVLGVTIAQFALNQEITDDSLRNTIL
jgi:hypothetical protein